MAHAQILLDYMYKLWQNGALTDTVICCQGSCVPAHSVILAAYSKSFATRIKSQQKVGSNFMIDISDTGLDLDSLWKLLEFFYTGQLALATSASTDSIARAAKELSVACLTERFSVASDLSRDTTESKEGFTKAASTATSSTIHNEQCSK